MRERSPSAGVAVLVVFLLAVAALWLVASLQLPHSAAGWRDLIPGALFYAAGILGVQVFNTYILDNLLASKSSTYGALGLAAAVLLSFFFFGRV